MTPERRKIRPLAALCLLLPVALAACESEKKVATGGSAGGEVLPGSASDAMLPVDSLRSQPPLAPKATASAGENGPKANASAADVAEAPSKDASPAEAEPETPAKAE